MKNTAKNRVKDGAQNAVKNGDAAVAVTRFAPSPTGHLHLGHAYAALFAWHAARPRGVGGVDGAPNAAPGGGSGGGPGGRGRFLLRIEDIDEGRCRPEFEAAILEDLAWLGEGLPGWGWETPVRRQSAHLDDYRAALAKLDRLGLLYPCFCTRAEIRAEAARAASAPQGPASQGSAPQELGGAIYPGTCRRLDPHQRAAKAAGGAPVALRLDMERAAAMAGPLYWDERARGRIRARPEAFGDVVLARKDIPTSYHLAVTLDDHLQGVSLVTRGEDLLESTHIHRLLQALLGLRTPVYLHHKLVTDDRGRRFAKRDRAVTIRALRAVGVSPAELRRRAGFEAD